VKATNAPVTSASTRQKLGKKKAMADADFEQRTRAFLGWFKSLPGATFHKDIQVVDLRPRNAGRGISEFFASLISASNTDR
jgi:hypothetical protein